MNVCSNSDRVGVALVRLGLPRLYFRILAELKSKPVFAKKAISIFSFLRSPPNIFLSSSLPRFSTLLLSLASPLSPHQLPSGGCLNDRHPFHPDHYHHYHQHAWDRLLQRGHGKLHYHCHFTCIISIFHISISMILMAGRCSAWQAKHQS